MTTTQRPSLGQTLFNRYQSLKRLGGLVPRKIPYVQQLAATECGSACLAMVLGYFGREVGLERIRQITGPGRDGISALGILQAAHLLGLRGRGVKVDINGLSRLVAGETILHWKFSHFVVFAGAGRGHVDIVDPAMGRRRIPMAQFREDFTGIALLFERNDLFSFEKRPGIMWRTIKTLVLSSGVLPRVILMSFVLQLCGLALPLLTGQLIDRVIPRQDLDLFFVLLLGAVMAIGFEGLASLVRGHLLLHLRTILDARMTLGFLDHLVGLPFSYFQSRGAGDLMMRLNSNAIVREQLTSATLATVLDGLFVVVCFVMLMVGDVGMGLAAAGAAAIEIVTYLLLRSRQRDLMAMSLEAQAKSRSYEVEMFTSMETLKASGSEHRAVAHWADLFVESTNVALQQERLTLKTGTALSMLRNLSPLVILAVGTLSVVKGSTTLGSMLALVAISRNFLSPLASLVDTFMSMEVVRGYLHRVNDVLEAKLEQNPKKVRIAPRLKGAITLNRVSFGYSPQKPTIEDVSLSILPGQFVAIVGPSGSGKSTLANLMIGLYRPTAGRILFDNQDLSELDLRSVREQIGIVNQNFGLFGTTIRQNIAFADPELTLEDVVAAAELACIHDDIVAMPLGYETPLVDRGGSLSGGQKQRLALARAVVRRPAVLVLDEATSALDTVVEARVQQALDRLSCTRIVIAHRLSTVARADVVLVVDGGRIVECGSPGELRRRGGAFARLVAAQGPENLGARASFTELAEDTVMVDETLYDDTRMDERAEPARGGEGPARPA
ncbi:MAG TPA: peptidase domain-containing ABC transporter [Polyangia bacterium]